MASNIIKYKSIYLFTLVLTIIGFFTGFFYYKVQPNDSKTYIKESINIQENLSTGTNNTFKSIKESSLIFVCGIFILSQLSNIIKIFFKPFEIGFIFSFLTTYNFKLAFIYILLYHFISLILTLILIRISLSISFNIIKLLLYRDRNTIKQLKLLCQKYLIVSIILIIYEIIISIFSTIINSYLMTFL